MWGSEFSITFYGLIYYQLYPFIKTSIFLAVTLHVQENSNFY